MVKRIHIFLLILGLVAYPAWADDAPVVPVDTKEPVVLEADQVGYDQNGEIATAEGHVIITQGAHQLRADKVTYNKQRDVVTAMGHVSIQDDTGAVSFAEQAEVTSDMKQGFVYQISMLLVDNSRFAAQEGERVDGRYIVLRRAVYSACDLCKDAPTRAPIWQLKAAKVVHDNEDKRITYRDAFLEFWGVPVFYTPYFSHPDPSVKRKSGFLTPLVGTSNNIGTFATIPYYYDIAPDKDLTISPTFSGKDGFQFAGQYRQRFVHGSLQFDGSMTVADRVTDEGELQHDALRGHLFGDVRFDLGQYHRAGLELAATSDKSYLYRYRIPTRDVLQNRAYVERFRQRSFLGLDAYYFQDLRAGDHQVEPVALRAQYDVLGEPNQTLGGRWDVAASVVNLTRDRSATSRTTRGPDSRRLSLALGWERQMVSDLGLVASIAGRVRGDMFWSNRLVDPQNPGNTYRDAYSGRVLPVGNVTLRYPLGRQGEAWQQLVEPIVMLTATPNLASNPYAANEDSQGTEFDYTNLYGINRFSGVDRFESGLRATYGLRAAAFGNEGGRYDLMFGTSSRLNSNDDFLPTSGLRDRQSDFVGYINAEPVSWFGARYNFRLNKDTFEPRYSELSAYAGRPWFRPSVQYLSVDGLDANNNQGTVAELTYGATSNFLPHWSVALSQRRALKSDAGPRSTRATLTYADECTTVSLIASRENVTRPDLESGTSFMLSIYLRNLGGFQTDSISTGGGNSPEGQYR